jgi:hypothetical protein
MGMDCCIPSWIFWWIADWIQIMTFMFGLWLGIAIGIGLMALFAMVEDE